MCREQSESEVSPALESEVLKLFIILYGTGSTFQTFSQQLKSLYIHYILVLVGGHKESRIYTVAPEPPKQYNSRRG